MGTRCRGLGEILARLTGPYGGQIVTRFQITERKSIIAQIVEISAMRCPSRWTQDGAFGANCIGRRARGLVHGDGECATGSRSHGGITRAGYGKCVGSSCGSRVPAATASSTTAAATAATRECANYGHRDQDAEHGAPATTPSRDSEEDEDRENRPGTGSEPALAVADFGVDQIGSLSGGCNGCSRLTARGSCGECDRRAACNGAAGQIGCAGRR